MKVSQIILEADPVDAATKKFNQEYEQKLKQLPAVQGAIAYMEQRDQ